MTPDTSTQEPLRNEEPTSAAAKVWRLLELVSIADGPDSPESAAAAEIARTGVDANELLARAARNGLVPGLADFLVAQDLKGVVPHHMQLHMIDALRWNKFRTEAHISEAVRISEGFDRAGVRVACNKGIVFQSVLYAGRHSRYFNDIDLMVHPRDTAAAAETLLSLGYTADKQYDRRSQKLVDLPRSEKVMFRLYPDHLPHFHRLLDGGGLPFFMVDVAYNVSWYGSGWQVPMDDVMSDLQRLPARPGNADETLPALAAPYGFLFLVLHLFREAWFERTVRKTDVRLTQFADIVRYWRRLASRQAGSLRAVIDRHGLHSVVAWVCHHTDSLYGTTITTEIGGLEEFVDPAWLQSAGAANGSYLAWSGDMRSRLNRDTLIELTPAPEPPYLPGHGSKPVRVNATNDDTSRV
ncbi:nucleotidyltransferase family protein [Micromonospora echinospora]|uniref:nucleotidyltransferase family protein n=1 Tax=Micromonospora echinospora TaxID=1877 RepID=UPI00342944FD